MEGVTNKELVTVISVMDRFEAAAEGLQQPALRGVENAELMRAFELVREVSKALLIYTGPQ